MLNSPTKRRFERSDDDDATGDRLVVKLADTAAAGQYYDLCTVDGPPNKVILTEQEFCEFLFMNNLLKKRAFLT